MEIIDYLYTGIVSVFSLGCIMYGIKTAVKIRKDNIKKYEINKEQRKQDFENYDTKN